jgi:hypothetical protein
VASASDTGQCFDTQCSARILPIQMDLIIPDQAEALVEKGTTLRE